MIEKKYIKNLVIRIMLCIILFLTVSIFVNYSDENLLLFKRNVYDQNLKFNTFNNLYQMYFGRPLPDNETSNVNKNVLTYSNATSYEEGAKLEGVNVVFPFKSGIVVFVGEKEGYGETIIIQGMNGIDYWYGNVTNINVKLYDYVASNSIIASANDNILYVLFKKDEEVLDFEEFI